MVKHALLCVVVVIGCKKSEDKAPPPEPKTPPVATPGSGSGSASAATPAKPAAAAKPQAKDAATKEMLDKGTTCKRSQGKLPLDCAEYKAIHDYAFQHQGSADVAETCAAYLQDPEPTKRLLAAACLDGLNAATVTPQLGAGLDAIEAEKDDDVRKEIAWGIKNAEAVTAKLDDRVIEVVNKLAADPKTEPAAGDVFDTLFPQYLASTGPKPPAKAQALALEAIKRDRTEMQRSAFNAIKLLDDKPAVCAALKEAIRPDAKAWASAIDAFGAVGEPCAADLPRVVELVVAKTTGGDVQIETIKRVDRVFELDAATRGKLAKALKAGRAKASEWERKSIDEEIAKLGKPKEAKK